MVVLACDPSISAFGWAIFEIKGGHIKLVDVGCIQTKSRPLAKLRKVKKTKAGIVTIPAIPRPAANIWDNTRLFAISHKLVDLLIQYKVDSVYWEDPCGSKDFHSNKALSQVKGLVIGMIVSHGLKSISFSAREVKKGLTGDRNAEKERLRQEVEKSWPGFSKLAARCNISTKAQLEAASDACAVFLYCNEMAMKDGYPLLEQY